MDNQNLVILAIGVVLALIITVTAIDQFLLDEHPPLEVGGLIWRVENAFSHIRDLESVLEITEDGAPSQSMRVLVRYLAGPPSALSVRYLHPDNVEGEIFTIQNDLLSHYFPQENLVVIKRWVGVPLAAIGLAGFDLRQLKNDWNTGRVRAQVLQNIAGFSDDLIPSPIVLSNAFAMSSTRADVFTGSVSGAMSPALSFSSTGAENLQPRAPSFSYVTEISAGNSIPGSYILEVRDAQSNELEQMIWVERDTFLVRKVVVYRDGKRQTTIRVEWIILDQGFVEGDLLNLPQRADVIRG